MCRLEHSSAKVAEVHHILRHEQLKRASLQRAVDETAIEWMAHRAVRVVQHEWLVRTSVHVCDRYARG